MHTMGEFFFCKYLWGVIYSIGNVIFRTFVCIYNIPHTIRGGEDGRSERQVRRCCALRAISMRTSVWLSQGTKEA